jgi:CRP-like cAMP-binding protein
MSKEKLSAFFQSTGAISSTRAKEIADQFGELAFSKNDFLLREGQVSNDYLFLSEGYMRGFAHDSEGNEVTTTFFSPGQVVFEVSSFFTRSKSRENIQALTDGEGWTITFEQLNHLFHSMPEFREFGRSVLVRGYASLKARMLNMITTTAEERYAQLLQSTPDIFLHAPLKHIASYLGITDSSLSRIRKEFAKK